MSAPRRTFLKIAGAATAAAGAFWNSLCEAIAAALRKATPPNILGPYYRKGAPEATRLHAAGDKGTALHVSGLVLDTDGKPLTGAIVDVWQANADGRYDNDDRRNPPPANVFRYRAVVKTDKDGKYAFETVVPGRYQIGGGVERPQHIHYMVSAAGCKTVITQLYFENDPFFEGNVDKNLKKDQFVEHRELVIPLKQDEKSKGFRGVFDVVLGKN